MVRFASSLITGPPNAMLWTPRRLALAIRACKQLPSVSADTIRRECARGGLEARRTSGGSKRLGHWVIPERVVRSRWPVLFTVLRAAA